MTIESALESLPRDLRLPPGISLHGRICPCRWIASQSRQLPGTGRLWLDELPDLCHQ